MNYLDLLEGDWFAVTGYLDLTRRLSHHCLNSSYEASSWAMLSAPDIGRWVKIVLSSLDPSIFELVLEMSADGNINNIYCIMVHI